ncbi:MAG: hypothetical protein ACFCGT_11635 [Sandaracinaceae bacterium]
MVSDVGVRRPTQPLAWLCVVLIASSSAATAYAQNDEQILIGPNAALTAGAVVATVYDGSATYHNPAGLVTVPGARLDVQGSVLGFRFSREPRYLVATSGESQAGDHFEVISVPTAAGVVFSLGGEEESPALGLGVFTTRQKDQQTRSVLLAEGQTHDAARVAFDYLRETTIEVGVGFGVPVSRHVRVGATLLLPIDTIQDITNRASYHEDRATGDAVGGVDAESLSDVFVGVSGLLGLLWQPSGLWSVGLTLRTPRLDYLRIRRDASYTLDAATVTPDIEFAAFDDVNPQWSWSAVVSEPAELRFGVARYTDLGWITAEVSLKHRLQSSRAQRNVLVNARAGIYGNVGDHVRLGGGFFTDLDPNTGDAALGRRRHTIIGWSGGLELLTPATIGGFDLNMAANLGLRYGLGFGDVRGVRFDPDQPQAEDVDINSQSTMHDVGIYFGASVTL